MEQETNIKTAITQHSLVIQTERTKRFPLNQLIPYVSCQCKKQRIMETCIAPYAIFARNFYTVDHTHIREDIKALVVFHKDKFRGGCCTI